MASGSTAVVHSSLDGPQSNDENRTALLRRVDVVTQRSQQSTTKQWSIKMRRQSISAGTMAKAQTMLVLLTFLLSSGLSHATNMKYIHHSRIAKVHPVATSVRGGAAIPKQEPVQAPANPCTNFPHEAKWALKKAPPKKSLNLLPIPQHRTAAAWILNLIELTHWASFPLAFYVAHYIFENAPSIESRLDSTSSRVFFLVLGLLCQVFGGGISGSMRHMYEGWQVAPFRNPFDSHPPGQKFAVEECNNAWLRSVAYEVHFTFQTLGLSLFTMGVYGFNIWTKALVGGTTAIALLGPKQPRLGFSRMIHGLRRPVLPLSKSLAAVFAINLVFNLTANIWLFTAALDDKVPSMFGGVELIACVASAIPALLVAMGGVIEGWFADTTFNQWHHFVASATMLAGLASSLYMYQRLVANILQG